MDDQSHLDYSTEGTIPVFTPGSDPVVPATSVPDPNPILLPAPGPGPASSPVSKRMKIMLGLFSAVILVSGLVTSLFLVRQKQDISSKAGSPGDCRCSGRSIVCEELDPTPSEPNHTKAVWKGDDPSCTEGAPPEFAPVYDNSGDRTGTAWQSNNSSGVVVGGNTTPQTDDITKATFKYGVNGNEVTNGSSPFVSQGTFGSYTIENGKLIPSDMKFGQPAPSTCGFKAECKTRADWEKGALDAKDPANWGWMRQTIDSTNGEVLKKIVYTDVAQDMDTNKPGHQVGSMAYDFTTGLWKVENIYDIGSQPPSTFCKSVETESACWARWLTEGSNNSFTINPVGTVNSSGQITYTSITPTSTSSSGKFTGVPQTLWRNNITGDKCIGSDKICNGYDNIGSFYCLSDARDIVKPTNPGSFTCNSANLAFYGKLETWGCRTTSGAYTNKCDAFYTGDMPIATTTVNWNGNSFTDLNKLLEYLKSKGYKYEINRFSCGKGQTVDQLAAAFDIPTGCSQNKEAYDQTKNGSVFGFTSTCGIQQIDIDIYSGLPNTAPEHISRNILDVSGCGTTTTTTFTPQTGTPTGGGGGNPPTTTTTFSGPTPTPTTTTNPQLACYQLQIFRGGTQIQPWQINQGDALIFRGFASVSGGAIVSKMRFTVTVGGVPQTPVDVSASLVGGLYQADYNYTITQNTSYSVSTLPI